MNPTFLHGPPHVLPTKSRWTIDNVSVTNKKILLFHRSLKSRYFWGKKCLRTVATLIELITRLVKLTRGALYNCGQIN